MTLDEHETSLAMTAAPARAGRGRRHRLKRVALIIETAIAPRRRMLAGVARYMHEHDPWAIYLKPNEVEKSLANWIRDWNGDGIIGAVAEDVSDLVKRLGIPIVDVVGFQPQPGIPLVHANDQSVGRMGAEHLLERGFRNFAYVEFPRPWSTERRVGFDAYVRSAGYLARTYTLPYPVAGSGGPSYWEQQQQLLVEWIQSLPKPVGVMTSTDHIGQQFLEACQRAQVVVPEQVAVIGADNDELICNICLPPLSSVIINDDQRGYQAAALLDQMMAGQAPPAETVYIEPAGVISRASTDILAIHDEGLATALRFIREHACDQITVDDVVAAVPMSRSVLARRFRKVVGRSVNDEIVRARLNRAVSLLCETQMGLKAIAKKAGFGSPAYMGDVFRKKLGRTPGSYRPAVRRSSGQLSKDAVPEE